MIILPELPDLSLQLVPDFIASEAAFRLFGALRDELPWQHHIVKAFGRSIPAPRLSSWHGDPECAYTYSNTRHEPQAWTPALTELRERLVPEFGAFNSVLANLYRSGADSMGWHSDDENVLGPEPVIASISLGAALRFCLRHRKLAFRHELLLTHGSLLIMSGRTQRFWQHALPRTARVGQPRINLTFRQVN